MAGLKVALLAAVLLILAVVNEWTALDPLIVALGALLLLCWTWSRFSLARLGMVRALSLDRVRAGETITEQLTIRNRSILPKLWVEVRDYSSLPGHQASRVVSLAPRAEETWTVTTVCTRRGRYQLGPVGVRSGDPLGLFVSRRFLPVRQELMVFPIPIDVTAIPLPAAHMSGGVTVSRTSIVPSSTIAGLRDYVPGDALNRISWTATARRGVMTVKEFDPDPTSDLWILLDLDARGMRPVEPGAEFPALDSTEEILVALAASLAERTMNDGRKVGLIVNRAMPVRGERRTITSTLVPHAGDAGDDPGVWQPSPERGDRGGVSTVFTNLWRGDPDGITGSGVDRCRAVAGDATRPGWNRDRDG